MERATTPMPQAYNRILFVSQRRVNYTDFTPITICCHVDYYMIKSCRDDFKVNYYVHEYVKFSIQVFFFKFDVKKNLMFC